MSKGPSGFRPMSAKPTIFLFERGINGWASIWGEWKNWPNLAIVWINKFAAKNELNWRAQTLTYFTGPILAGLTRRFRAFQFSKLIRSYSVDDWDIIIVAHSEGTATVLEALRQAGWPKIKVLHLVCGACDSNFARNGLNFALRESKIDRIVCYRAGRDLAMEIEDTTLGLLMFGISWNDLPLGLSGPVNVAGALWGNKVFERTLSPWSTYGHSDCWEKKNLDVTMMNFIG